jgi:hypothetical protein
MNTGYEIFASVASSLPHSIKQTLGGCTTEDEKALHHVMSRVVRLQPLYDMIQKVTGLVAAATFFQSLRLEDYVRARLYFNCMLFSSIANCWSFISLHYLQREQEGAFAAYKDCNWGYLPSEYAHLNG